MLLRNRKVLNQNPSEDGEDKTDGNIEERLNSNGKMNEGNGEEKQDAAWVFDWRQKKL